ncbi:MAG: alanine--glyoxylate aminotransferase family protein [Gemmatimonadaceae bacterium]|nr:alanine--glyoxylate aminotransferase family protein [Gemmatimonadaceae bacterium]
MSEKPFGSFFLPGPTEVRPEVLAAMSRPMLAHRGKAFEDLFASCQSGLQAIFGTARPVYVGTCSATGFMEAGIRNARPGRVLALVNGQFSERFANIARACGREVDEVRVEYGGGFDLAHVRRALGIRDHALVTVVHSETSTGVLTDVHAVTALAHEHGAMCLIDGVTSVGAMRIDFDASELDYVLTGSQKGLALPPGLAFAVASQRYIDAAAQVEHRGLYFDLVEYERFIQKNQTPNTPAVSLLYALQVQMERILAEGVEARYRRHAAMRDATVKWVGEAARRLGIAMHVLAPEGQRSPTVTTIVLPAVISPKALVSAVAIRGITIGGGLGPLAESTYRIGHMGEHTLDGLGKCLCAVEGALMELTSNPAPSG